MSIEMSVVSCQLSVVHCPLPAFSAPESSNILIQECIIMYHDVSFDGPNLDLSLKNEVSHRTLAVAM